MTENEIFDDGNGNEFSTVIGAGLSRDLAGYLNDPASITSEWIVGVVQSLDVFLKAMDNLIDDNLALQVRVAILEFNHAKELDLIARLEARIEDLERCLRRDFAGIAAGASGMRASL